MRYLPRSRQGKSCRDKVENNTLTELVSKNAKAINIVSSTSYLAHVIRAPTAIMSDSTLYLYDSLSAETSHTIANLSRIETTLAACDVPYKVIDVTTDDKALELWDSQSNGRTLPALVKFGRVICVCPPSSTASPSKESKFTNSV